VTAIGVGEARHFGSKQASPLVTRLTDFSNGGGRLGERQGRVGERVAAELDPAADAGYRARLGQNAYDASRGAWSKSVALEAWVNLLQAL
jgi:hypothetical protein